MDVCGVGEGPGLCSHASDGGGVAIGLGCGLCLAQVERLRKEHDAEIAGMQALCGRLESQVTSYHEALSARMRPGVA